MTGRPSPPVTLVPDLTEHLLENVSWSQVYFQAHSMQKSSHPQLENTL